MEVSSEHGHNAGDDIDIDLDLTAGHVDEDYILEDATSNIGMDDDLQPPPSPTAGNDESMIDEDEEQYNGHDEDLDELILDEGTDNIEHQAISISFDNTAPSGMHTEGNQAGNVPAEMSEKAIGNHSEPAEVIEEASTEINEQLHCAEELTGAGEGGVSSLPVEEAVASSSHNTSRASTPCNAITDHLKSPPATSPGSPKEANIQPITELDAPNSPEDSGKAADVIGVPRDPSSREVVVFYQDTEYALFSSSELDDPDSFFLSDLSVTDKSLSSFFEAIRGVIHEDLADDDELCIAVEDLGLEIMEVSYASATLPKLQLTLDEQNETSSQDITFNQILDLRSMLLQNDGVDSPGPLYLILATRTNFSRKFASLSRSAEEGKGLSEVVYWDEHSESPEFEGVGEDGLGDEAVVETQNLEEASDEISNLQEELQDPSLGQSSTKDSNDVHGSATAQQTEPIHATALEGVETLGGDAGDRNSNGDPKEEEGDLIDYSDEELEATHIRAESNTFNLPTDSSSTHNGTYTDFVSPCLKPSSCFCSKCSALIVAEEQAKDEELRRRSLSRAAEDAAPEQQTENTVTSDKNGLTETTLDAEDGVDYDEDDYHEEVGPSYLNAEHDDPSVDNGEVDHTEIQVQSYNDESLLGDNVDSHEKSHKELEAADSTSESRNEFEPGEHGPDGENVNGVFDDGLEFGENDFTASEEYPGLPEGDLESINGAPSVDLHNLSKGPTEIDLEAPDAESDTVGSDKTLEALPASEVDQEDEIDYDDEDEEQDTLGVRSIPLEPKEVPSPQYGLGKRPRTEETSDEGMSMSSKGSYANSSEKSVLLTLLRSQTPQIMKQFYLLGIFIKLCSRRDSVLQALWHFALYLPLLRVLVSQFA
jgi:hypothetical protein